jgi:hypothetical protein
MFFDSSLSIARATQQRGLRVRVLQRLQTVWLFQIARLRLVLAFAAIAICGGVVLFVLLDGVGGFLAVVVLGAGGGGGGLPLDIAIAIRHIRRSTHQHINMRESVGGRILKLHTQRLVVGAIFSVQKGPNLVECFVIGIWQAEIYRKAAQHRGKVGQHDAGVDGFHRMQLRRWSTYKFEMHFEYQSMYNVVDSHHCAFEA